MNFYYNFVLLTKTCVKVSEGEIAQVIKKHIYLSGAKSNHLLHIVYTPNVIKFTKISAKGTQESPKRYPMNDHKYVERDHASQLAKSSQHHTFVIIQEWLCYIHSFHFFIICRYCFP